MADKTAELTAPNGCKVTVAADRVEFFTQYGFSEIGSKAPAKKASSKPNKK